jgi:hypothetical protein
VFSVILRFTRNKADMRLTAARRALYSRSTLQMNNRRASPAVSLTFMFYSDTETAQAASLHVFFDIRQPFVLDS